jgi:membrane fusion protein, copper/silver efflux system
MKRVMIFAVVLALTGVAAWQLRLGLWLGRARHTTEGAVRFTSGPFQVAADFRPNPPRTGRNQLILTLRGLDGTPVEGADIEGAAVMPAMGAMQQMRAEGKTSELGGGRYRLEFDLSMEGGWPLSLAVKAPDGRKTTLAFDYATKVPVRRAGGSTAEAGGGAERPQGAVQLDSRRRQLVGVRTGRIERRAVTQSIRAVGHVTYDETRLADVTLKYRGWIGKVFADYTGIRVEKGKPLFTIYAPELLSAQEEFLETWRRAGSGAARDRSMLEKVRRRLTLWDLTPDQVARLAGAAKAEEYVPILSPISGTVVEKNVVDGTAVSAGMRLYRIADLSTVWVEADIYESDVPVVGVGQAALITLSYLPGQSFKGTISYVYPYLDARTRTGRIRIEVPNPGGALKPEMYANVELEVPQGEQLVVPEGAVIMAGETDLVFLADGDGYFEPRKVRIGRRVEGGYVVLDGVHAGDTVVTSGNFLIASESKLKTGVEKW